MTDGVARGGRTLARAVTWDGIGLHSGARVRVSLEPAERGVIFERTDLPGAPRVAACVATALTATRGRHTVLEWDGVRVATVEHVLSVLSASGITAALIRLDGEEVPDAGDGSTAPLAAWVLAAGIADASAPAPPLRLREPLEFHDGAARFVATPSESFEVHCVFDHPHPHLGRQEFGLALDAERYRTDIAPARTFATTDEVAQLRARGLALGGSLENAVVVGPSGPLGGVDWRFEGEAVRHKILDLIGDLSLLGRPLHACVRAERNGHRANVRFAAALEAAACPTDSGAVD